MLLTWESLAEYELFAPFIEEEIDEPLRRSILYLNRGKHAIVIKQQTKFLEPSLG